jgi:peptidoglycan/LPS O-acetylase OafA/YrhL
MAPLSTASNIALGPDASGASSKRPHLPFLDGLRALAALLVVLYHVRIFQTDDSFFSPLGNQLTDWMQYGHFAVGVFIVLSGFCLMLPVTFRDGSLPYPALVFFQRRAHRILPPYYFALLLSLGLIAAGLGRSSGALLPTLWHYSYPVTGLTLGAHILLVQNFLGGYMRTNPVFWSIAVEWQLYFFFPLLVLLFRRWGTARTTGAAFLLTLVGIWLAHHLGLLCSRLHLPLQFFGPQSLLHLTPQYFCLFVLGMFGAQIAFGSSQLSRYRLPWGVLAGLAAGLLLAMRLRLGLSGLNRYLDYADLLVGLSAICLLIYLARNPQSLLRRALDFPPLVAVGLFSYSLYLIHLPLLQVFWQYGLHPFGLSPLTEFALLIFPGVPLIVGGAYGFHRIAERPFMNSKQQKSLKLAMADSEFAPRSEENRSVSRQ